MASLTPVQRTARAAPARRRLVFRLLDDRNFLGLAMIAPAAAFLLLNGIALYAGEVLRRRAAAAVPAQQPVGAPVEHTGEIVGQLALQIARVGRRTPPRATQVGAEHPVAVGGQRTDQLVPLPPVLREAVHQHDGRPLGRTGVGDVDRHTVAQLDVPVFDSDGSFERGHGDHAFRS